MSTIVFRLGDRGPAIAEIRARLARLGLLEGSAHVRGDDSSLRPLMRADESRLDDTEPAQWDTTALVSAEFDERVRDAVVAFQRDRGITVDGIVGPETFERLEEARWLLGDRVLSYQPGHPFVGEDVLQLQRHLNRMGFECGREDSHFGPKTDGALRDFQRNVGLDRDGVAGPETLRALGRLHRTVGDQSAHQARERYSLSKLQTGLAGKHVIIDPGRGGLEEGNRYEDLDEAKVVAAIASQIEVRLAALGTRVTLTRPTTNTSFKPMTAKDRALFCNETDADLVVSLHADPSDSAPENLGVFYFGQSDTVFSAAGREAASSIAEGLADALPDRTIHSGPRTYDILRLTRMPTVRIAFGRFHDESVRRRLNDAGFQREMGASVAAAIGDFFAPPTHDERAG